MVDGRRKNRVIVWPSYEDAAAAKAAAADVDCKLTNRITSWPTNEQAAAHSSTDGDGLEELAFADFVNGVYRKAGVAATVGDIVVEDAGADWSAFDPETGITGDGLIGKPVIAGALEATLLADGFTVIVEYMPLGVTGSVQIDAYDSPDYNEEWKSTIVYSTDEELFSSSYVKAAGPNNSFDPVFDAESPIKYALTIAADHVSVSVNGGEVHTATTVEEAIYNNIGLNPVDAAIRTMTFYPPQADADLPALSEVEGAELPTPKAVADFANGVYTVGASTYAVTDFFDEDGEAGSTFTTDDIVPDSGLKGPGGGGTSVPSIIGPLLDSWLGTEGSTVVVDFVATVSEEAPIISFDAFNSPTWDIDVVIGVGRDPSSQFVVVGQSDSATDGAYVTGQGKIAFTFSNSLLSMSINGGDVLEIDAPSLPDWSVLTKLYVGSSNVDFIKSIKLYDIQSNDVLPALSGA